MGVATTVEHTARRAVRSSPQARSLARWLSRHISGDDYRKTLTSLRAFAPSVGGDLRVDADLTLRSASEVFPQLVRLAERAGPPAPTLDLGDFCPTGPGSADAEEELGRLFTRHGSDKSTAHSYHRLYARLLRHRSATKVVEVGIGTNDPDIVSNMGAAGTPGASLRAFRDYLPHAQVYGADIDERVLFSDTRIATCRVDQMDPSSFGELASLAGDDVDLVIDDGLHTPTANLTVLQFGADRVRRGGWIVIEDIAPEAEPVWRVVSRLLPTALRPTILRDDGSLVLAVERVA